MTDNGWYGTLGLCVLLWGLMTFLPKLAVAKLSPASCIVYEIAGGLTVALIVLLWPGTKLEFEPRGALLSYTVGICGFLGTLAYFFAVTRGPVSLAAPLSALYPIVAVLLGVFLLKEQLSPQQMLGAALALVSIVLMAR